MTPAGAGMSPGTMGALGGVAMLGGGILDYIGQMQGARALEAEAGRQAAEQGAMLQARHAALLRALERADPRLAEEVAGRQLGNRVQAAAPALRAGGKALGMTGAQSASAGAALLPVQRVAAARAASAENARRMAESDYLLRNEQGDIDSSMQAASALYPARAEMAQNRGAMLRTGGQMLSSVGMPLLVMGMSQPAGAPAAPAAPEYTGRLAPVMPAGSAPQTLPSSVYAGSIMPGYTGRLGVAGGWR